MRQDQAAFTPPVVVLGWDGENRGSGCYDCQILSHLAKLLSQGHPRITASSSADRLTLLSLLI